MRNIIIIITLIMSVMLFTGNPFDSSLRLYQAIWNTGHLFFFALLTGLLITQTPLSQQGRMRILLVSLLFALLLGGLIEILQFFIGRSMELLDLFTDVLGALLGYLVVLQSAVFKQRPVRYINRPVNFLLSGIVLVVAFYPVFDVIKDNSMIESDFPVIADFESENSLDRWGSRHVGRFETDRQIFIEGESSVLIEFEVGRYPRVVLDALYRDWSSYDFLNLSIHNDQKDTVGIKLKVYDMKHLLTGSVYSDRFSQLINLEPGWNTLQFKLLDIRNAPKTRRMNLKDIAGLSLFIQDPDEVKLIHLDNIYLSK